MSTLVTPSPLDSVKNLKPLSPEQVQAFLDQMKNKVIPNIREHEMRQAVLVASIRNTPLF